MGPGSGTKENQHMSNDPGKPSSNHYDLAIVGAGIVGLAAARECLLRQPDFSVIVLDKELANAPSPAATSSLVIARMIVDEAQRSFNLISHEKV